MPFLAADGRCTFQIDTCTRLRLLSALYVDMHIYRMMRVMLKDNKEWEAKKKRGGRMSGCLERKTWGGGRSCLYIPVDADRPGASKSSLLLGSPCDSQVRCQKFDNKG